MPSYVAFTDSGILVGEAAKKQELQNPTNTVFDIMRSIGRRFSDPSVRNDMKLWPFKVVPYPDDKAGVEVFWKGKVWKFTPEEILSMILTRIKGNAKTNLGTTVTDVVVAIPVCFNYEQRHAVKRACIIAGLNLMRLISAPTAVGMFYSLWRASARNYTFANILTHSMFTEEHNMVIFDLGAGTFDVSVITLRGDACQVRATAGDAHLGGKDIDKNMVEYFADSLKSEDKRNIASIREIIKLRIVSENAKISLSSGATQKPTEFASLNNDDRCQNSITKAKFNELNKDLFLKCIDIMEVCLKDAKMDHSMVHEIILAGGSTGITSLQLYLRYFFKIKELNTTKHHEMAATYGASIQAFLLSGRGDSRLLSLSLLDVTPFSLGIQASHGVMSVFIPKNTSIPTKNVKNFRVNLDNVSKLNIEVYEGEGSMTRENNLLEKFEIPKSGNEFSICFEIDVNCALIVSAECLSSKVKNSITITSDNNNPLAFEMCRKRVWEALLYKEERERNADNKSTTKNSSENGTTGIWIKMTEKGLLSKISSLGKEKHEEATEEGGKQYPLIYKEEHEKDADNASTTWISSKNGTTGIWNKMREKGMLSKISSLGKEKREEATEEGSKQYVEPKEYAIGIDFGTTYSSVGVWQQNDVKIIDNEYDNPATHSSVAFTETGRLIGDSVNKEEFTMNPANAIYSKLFIS
ncbi:hypothetical protein LUZ60_010026 [Juncus effusus]|nr:hypothetical protein LUZ60_010026 [Juncus effusus]